MGDGLKLSKDKRHRSSSSLAGAALERTRSERKMDQKASIPELDQFTIAEGRCDDLQEKIDTIKLLRKKKKLKKRSMTRISETKTPDMPFTSVSPPKAPKKTARLRRLEIPPNPTRGYLDPATVEQHQMIGQVRGYNHSFKHPHVRLFQLSPDQRPYLKLKMQRSHADGDSMCSQRSHASDEGLESVACGQDEISEESGSCVYKCATDNKSDKSGKKPVKTAHRRQAVPRGIPAKEGRVVGVIRGGPHGEMPALRRRQPTQKTIQPSASQVLGERPVVELFKKSRATFKPRRQGNASVIPAPMNMNPEPLEHNNNKVHQPQKIDSDNDPVESMQSMEHKNESTPHPRRVKYRTRGYELPTISSQMKHVGVRTYGNFGHANIPFVVSKSTAPSHNIGVNIQQVLNGVKIQQPVSGIPLTIAHHMGLGHVPSHGAKTASNQQPSLDQHSEMNAIRVGRRLVKLPSYKCMSYNRLLSLYREGDGMVPRFLRAIDRPLYTSMYNLATDREDFDCATSKGRGGSQEAKQSLAEYASLYREYQQIDKCIREGNTEPELLLRKEELTRELAAREEHIRKVVNEFRTGGEPEQPLRATASTAEEGYRHCFKLGDAQQ